MSLIYEIVFETRAKKELDKVHSEIFSKIDKAIGELAKNPRPFGVKKLDEHIHRIRVQDWRILFAVFDKELRVVILRIARRNEKTYKFTK